VAFFVVVFLSACALASRSRSLPDAQDPDGEFAVAPAAQGDIQVGAIFIPAVDPADAKANAAPRQAALPKAAPAKDGCKPDGAGDRETFGTAVEFARNPLEATRAAGQQRKLALLLHVSGNFEEARFT
jgi:hypothetical protein